MPITSQFQSSLCYDKVAVIDNSTTSAAIDIAGTRIVGLVTPASLGATVVTFLASTSLAGTYVDVNDADGAALSITVSTSSAGWADLTSVFPASIRFIKIKVNATITKNITLITAPV